MNILLDALCLRSECLKKLTMVARFRQLFTTCMAGRGDVCAFPGGPESFCKIGQKDRSSNRISASFCILKSSYKVEASKKCQASGLVPKSWSVSAVYWLSHCGRSSSTPQNVPDAPQPKPQAQQSQFPDDAPPAPKNDHPAGDPTAPVTPSATRRAAPQPGVGTAGKIFRCKCG